MWKSLDEIVRRFAQFPVLKVFQVCDVPPIDRHGLGSTKATNFKKVQQILKTSLAIAEKCFGLIAIQSIKLIDLLKWTDDISLRIAFEIPVPGVVHSFIGRNAEPANL